MCGILGIACDAGLWEERLNTCFEAGLNRLEHRGPDSRGTRVVDGLPKNTILALGHQRLSVLDLSPAGGQPMADGKGRIIVYNGEIFNWVEIRAELEAAGYSFVTQSDAEVLLAAWDRWGAACVEHFNGIWAFVLFDPEGSARGGPLLVFCRDRFGIKPLYLIRDKGMVAFCSEIKPLLLACNRNARINPGALVQQLLFESQSAPARTLYEEVEEVSPATLSCWSIDDQKWQTIRYWNPEAISMIKRTDARALEEFSWLIEDATSIRLRADVEVALTLSGGIDSSAIAMALAGENHGDIKAFTSRFRTALDLDETGWSALAARKAGIKQIFVDVEDIDLDAEERLLSRHMETMYTSFSQLVNWVVIKAIKTQTDIKVLLNGQGGDEIFLGYERYYVPHILNPDRSALSWLREWWLSAMHSKLSMLRLLGFLVYFSADEFRRQRYARNGRAYLQDWLLKYAEDGSVDRLISDKRLLTIQETCGPQLQRLLRFDDRISAAFGMEGRPVFLDHRMVEFGISLEGTHKIRDGWTKYIIRRYLDKKGLPEIAWRKNKLGFPAPTREWTASLLKIRGEELQKNAFMRSVLRQGLDIQALTDQQISTILRLHSAAKEIQWEPVVAPA
ncbi:MAG: asparagine synthase (glutamine-hydrolyzing) [Gammaproteobacteria bacterium]|nr:asparagine synthase (glutamine-hydrolyzing) [Gammaproteobacteria bacterium]